MMRIPIQTSQPKLEISSYMYNNSYDNIAVRELDNNLNIICPKKPKATQKTICGNYKAISRAKATIKLRGNVPRKCTLRYECLLSSGGCHELGKIFHFVGTIETLAHTSAVLANEFHGSQGAHRASAAGCIEDAVTWTKASAGVAPTTRYKPYPERISLSLEELEVF